MAGVKGKSGRKTHYDSLAIAEVVNLSIKTVRDYLRDENIPIEKKVFVAKDFALKRLPNKVEGEGITEYTKVQIFKDIDEDRVRDFIATCRKGSSSEESA